MKVNNMSNTSLLHTVHNRHLLCCSFIHYKARNKQPSRRYGVVREERSIH